MELFTACCRRGQLLLKDDEHKKIVLQSIAFLCRDQRIRLFGYVILEDEFHLLWEKQPDWQAKNIRQMMLKFTAQQIKYRLLRTRSPELEKYKSTLNDRHYHFWDKATYFRQIPSIQMAEETIRHLHEAPVLTGLSPSPEMYAFSSARFYQKSFHSTISPIADTYIDITESAKTYNLVVIKESEGYSKRDIIDIPECGKKHGLSVIGASEGHPENKTIDVPECEKTYDQSFFRESHWHSKGETINIPECEKAYDLSVTGESEGHPENKTVDVPECEKTYDQPFFRESHWHSKGETINIPEREKAYDLSVTGASEGHPENKTIDAAEKLEYAAAEDPKSMAEAEAPETRDTQDYHKLRQLVFNRKLVPNNQTGKINDEPSTIKLIYRSLNLSGIIRPEPVNGVSIVSPVKGEKENSAVITNFRVVFKVLKNDSG
ncbi:MAG: hypothetical protein ACTHLD_04825 [Chitinophaga sp.]